jgi:hypothetical protein
MTSHEYATELKKLADEMLACPDFQLGWSDDTCTLGIGASKDELLAFAKNLRPLRKEYSDTQIKLFFGSGRITAEISADRTVACRIVEPAKPPVYECDPLLAPEEEAAL